jgi:hypothetical protein
MKGETMKFNVETYDGECDLPNMRIGDFVLAVENKGCPNLAEHMAKVGIAQPDFETISLDDIERVQHAMTSWLMEYGISGELIGRTDDSLHLKTVDKKIHVVALEDVMAVIQQGEKKEMNR